MKLQINEKSVEVKNLVTKEKMISFELDGKKYQYELAEMTPHYIKFKTPSGIETFSFQKKKDKTVIFKGNNAFEITDKRSSQQAGAQQSSANIIKSPMPGKIFKINKKVGESVKVGEVIVVLEAMKMEHPLKAPRDGKIKAINGSVGEQKSVGDIVVVFEESNG
jgi:acetyl/propionyl-CoA carboxylase alpha subunit